MFNLNETLKTTTFKPYTAGYILEDGSFIILHEYHGEDSEYRDLGLPEFSNTHTEDDTCVRIYKKPNKIQYKRLEEIIDNYLTNEGYCKIELWDHPLGDYYFYNVYSLFEGACKDITWNEKIGNWNGYKLVQIIKNNIDNEAYNNFMNEEFKVKKQLKEASRNQLLSKSKKSASYKDSSKGNRWTAKSKCTVANTVKDYNKIDMNTFWKDDILNFKVKVQGETDLYEVTVQFSNILDRIQKKVKENNNKLTIKEIYNPLVQALNSSDLKVECSCPDFKYRLSYYLSKEGSKVGEQETREAKITNPNNDLGLACKHILCVLNNLEWLNKIASVINNYINYCKDNMQYNYSKFIFPKVYGIPYNKAVQMCLDDYDEKGKIKDTLDSSEELINLSNALGKVRGRIKPGSNKNPVSKK